MSKGDHMIDVVYSAEDMCYVATVAAHPLMSGLGPTRTRAAKELAFALSLALELYTEAAQPPLSETDLRRVAAVCNAAAEKADGCSLLLRGYSCVSCERIAVGLPLIRRLLLRKGS